MGPHGDVNPDDRLVTGNSRVYTTAHLRRTMLSPCRRLLSGIYIVSLFASTATMRAQVNGSILGTAADSSKAAVPGVAVRVVNVDTNLSQATVTDPFGQYRFLALAVGRYR